MGESDTFEISSQGDNRALCARSPVLDDKTWGISGNSDAPGRQCQGGRRPASTKNVADLLALEQKHFKSAPTKCSNCSG